jgi:hypothetical protein
MFYIAKEEHPRRGKFPPPTWFRIAMISLLLVSGMAQIARGDDTNAPSAPQIAKVVDLSETTSLISWSPSTDDVGVTSYEVYRDGASLGSTADTNFTDDGPLDKYRSYEYAITARDAANNTSPPSAANVFAYHRFPFIVQWTQPSFSSVADLSSWSSGPANSAVTISNGHFSVSGQRVRLFGVNFVGLACFPSHDIAEKVSATLARLGINCARFTSVDKTAPSGIFMNVATNDSRYLRCLDPTQLERMDYFIAQLKSRGIYVDLTLHMSRNYAGFPADGVPLSFHGVDNFYPPMIALQKQYASDLLTHVNPYTGLAYTREPALALIEINNENSLIYVWKQASFAGIPQIYLDELKNQWNAWLAARYTNTVALADAWAPSAGFPAFGTELLTNGNFTGGTLAPWAFEVAAPAVSTNQILPNDAPDGSNALFMNITAAGLQTSDVQLYQGGLNLVSNQELTVRFWAKASPPRAVTVGLLQNHPPFGSLDMRTMNLSTNWQEHTLVFQPPASETNGRVLIGGMGSQTGMVWIANASARIGNQLLATPVAEGVYGLEMITNGTFTSFSSPWNFQATAPAGGSYTILTNGAPNGSNAVEVTVTTNANTGGSVQIVQLHVNITNGQTYTIRYSGRSDAPRTIHVALREGAPTYSFVGDVYVSLTTNWQDYAYTVVATETVAGGRLLFGDLADQTGKVWLANVSLKPGTPGLGLPAGETLGNVSLFWPDQAGGRSRAAQTDWMRFLWDTERSYWNEMRDYLKNTLGAKALIIGTQTLFDPAPIQADMDVVDTHAYWNMPNFPVARLDPVNWYMHNMPMAGVTPTTSGTINGSAPTRIAGKPFVCTEYNHPAPNTFSAETLPLAAAYAALQDWDGVFAFQFLTNTNLAQPVFSEWFDLARHPAKLISFPMAAAILRRSAVASTADESTATIPSDLAIQKLLVADSTIGAVDFGVDAAEPYQQRVSLASGATAEVHATLRDGSQNKVVSDTEQLTWDYANGLCVLRAPTVKAVVGNGNQQTFDLGDGVLVTPGETMQGSNWATITLAVLEGSSFQSSPSRILITAAGYTDNHRMIWKSGMGPTNSTSSVGSNWGQSPSLMEGFPVAITLPAPTNQVKVWALDEFGQRKTPVPVTGGSVSSFTLGLQYASPWYEVAIGYHAAPLVQFTAPLNNASVFSNVIITATATDADGSITKIELFSDGANVAESNAATFTYALTNVAPGAHTLTAIATDDSGATDTNSIFIRSVIPAAANLLPAGSTWRFEDSGTDLGTAWRSSDYDDSAWKTGTGRFGFGVGGESSLIASNGQMTTYFRRQFYVPDPTLVQSLAARFIRDDGVVVYLNGYEFFRTNLSAWTLSFSLPAGNDVAGTARTNWQTRNLTPGSLIPGWNLLAAEVHLRTNTSSDLAFDLELTGTSAVTSLPTLSIGDRLPNLTFSWPAEYGLFSLYTSTNLAPALWTKQPGEPQLTDGLWRAVLPITANRQQFYRLQAP